MFPPGKCIRCGDTEEIGLFTDEGVVGGGADHRRLRVGVFRCWEFLRNRPGRPRHVEATGAAAFAPADLTSFCHLDELGLVVTGQHVACDQAVLACDVAGGDGWCRGCGGRAVVRDSVAHRLAQVPLGWRPTTLVVRVRRYACKASGRTWRQDTSRAAAARAALSKGALAWALEALVVGHLSVARIADALGVAWNTANDAVLAEGKRVLISDPARFEGVRVIGVDGHVWRHAREGDKYVTVIIDLTPVRDRSGPAPLFCQHGRRQLL